jgi:hypothetical protein
MPYEGGEAVRPANEVRLNNIPTRVSTPKLKFLCLFSGLRKTHENMAFSVSYAKAHYA